MKKIFNILIIASFILAIICGIYMPSFMNSISFIGDVYIKLLKLMINPVIFTSIVVTIYKTSTKKEGILLKTILTFIIMFIITFLITSLIVSVLKPGSGFSFKELEWTGKIEELKLSNIILNMFNTSSLFGTIIIAFVFGFASSKVKKSINVINIIETVRDILYKIIEYIMYLTPFGIFSLVGVMTANYKLMVLEVGFKYVLVAYLCSMVVLILVMMVPVCIKKKISPFNYLKKMSKIFIMTLTTCSSVATLPTTMKVCKEEFDVSSKTTDIVSPLGCTIHMCGGAVSFALLALFCSQHFGISINFQTYMLMIISATIINMAAPGIPNGGIVIGATYLSILNIPLSFMGLYSSIYKLLDMAYTTLNVSGDVTANVLLDKK